MPVGARGRHRATGARTWASQLTLNAEHDLYRWGPITHAPSLLDGDGGFPRTVADMWDHADLDEARRELRAQVERAILWGFDVSHLDSHLGALQRKPEFFDIYLDLAVDFGLPAAPARRRDRAQRRLPLPHARRRGGRRVPRPLRPREPPWAAGGPSSARSATCRPGVTEVHVHPAVDTPELRAQTPDWPARVDDHDLVVDAHSLRPLLDRVGARADRLPRAA